jgi:hypothetical protein|tara:strand:- start:7708 stop:8343 length:636 start_codon:yes stop_codon:yes gene_type:complete
MVFRCLFCLYFTAYLLNFLLKTMKSLLIAFTLLFGLITPAFADEDVADRAIRCSALIYIELTRPEMSGLTAGEALMNRIYAYHVIDGEEMDMTNGQITAAQTEAITKLTQEYIKGANLAEEYRNCVYWMTDIAKYINISEYVSNDDSTEEFDAKEMALFLSAPTETSVTTFKNPVKTWEQQVDLGFVAWASQELKVPYKEAILLKISEKFE